DHADLAARVNIVADQSFGRLARGLLLRSSLPALAQDVDGLLKIARGLEERGAAIGKTRSGPFAEFFYEFCGCVIGIGAHSFSKPLLDRVRFSVIRLRRFRPGGLPPSPARRRALPPAPRLQPLPRNRLPASHKTRRRWCP